MQINRKSLLIVMLIGLLVLAVGGTVLVAAQTELPATEVEADHDGDSVETPASAVDALLTEAEVMAIAQAERGSTVVASELEREGGVVIYSIELADGSEVEIDANTGAILQTEFPGVGGN